MTDIEAITSLKNKQTAALSSLTKKRNELSELMTTEDMLHHVKTNFDSFNELYAAYQKAHSSHVSTLSVTELPDIDDRVDKETQRFEDKQNSILQFKTSVMNWISQAENALSENMSVRSQSSSSKSKRSRQSHGSSRSSQLSSRSREKAKVAELLAEKSMLHRKAELELNKEKLRIDTEIVKAQAREKVYTEEHDQKTDIDNLSQAIGDVVNVNVDSVNRVPSLQNTIFAATGSQVPAHKPYMIDQANAMVSSLPVATDGKDKNNGAVQGSTSMIAPATTASEGTSLSTHHGTQIDNRVEEPQRYIMNPGAISFYPGNSTHSQLPDDLRTNELEQTKQLVNYQAQLFNAISLPQPQVPKFSEEPIDFKSFIMAFDTRIASRLSSNSDRLYYLEQHLEGEAKDLIGGCLHMDPDVGYQEARSLLQTQYGDPYKVATAYIDKVLKWPTVKHDDSNALRKLYFLLVKCNNAMCSMSEMSVLNHAPNMQAIVQKLPNYMQNKWRGHAALMRKQQRPVTFSDLVMFVHDESEAANDPVYGREAMTKSDSRSTNKDASQAPKSHATSFATEYNQGNSGERKRNLHQTCLFCNQGHDLDSCKDFRSKSISDKRSFIMSQRRCFGCYGMNHMARDCRNKRTCEKCQKPHPTAFHIDNYVPTHTRIETVQEKPESKSVEVQASACDIEPTKEAFILHSILPVTIQKEGSDKILQTYAFYDNGSSGCFISQELMEDLGATGFETLLKLRTMHGIKHTKTTAVQGLVVSDLDGNNKIHLPVTYGQQQIPVSPTHIPRPEYFQQWPHLDEISNEIKSYNPNLTIGLLIGSNCPIAMEPLKVISGGENGPYATLLRHGWTINGPVEVVINTSCRAITCNSIALQEVETSKEVFDPKAINKMFEHDFSEKNLPSTPDQKGHSQEDLKFLEKTKNGIRFLDGHYEVPLPFRKEDVFMPNNRGQALSRVKWQRKKMMCDSQYRDLYTAFIANLLSKGFATKVPDAELLGSPGKIWYLPHHGVFHPQKPNKIRVVFDASAQFEGRSLNSELLQGPDLTNSLVGVLNRFRQGDIAFMADIEAMFHQVKVPKQQHDFLRFLWWPNDNLCSEPEEYRMNVHLFGAISSPSVANFVLKYVADKGEETYGTMAADTIRNNFYVDDCLRAIDEEDGALKLITDVTAACAEGGFRLTKFVCDRSEVLCSIPKEELSKDMQACNLDYDDLPVERALGIQWNIQRDAFEFSIKLKQKEFTRRGMLSTICSIYDPLGFLAPCILPAKKLLQTLCKERELNWDDIVPADYRLQWEEWLNNLPMLKDVSIQRSLKPKAFPDEAQKDIHVFSDASSKGYGVVSYFRVSGIDDSAHCSFLMGKARVTPAKTISIPRLELSAATVALRIGQQLAKELSMDPRRITYHTDSTTVIHYIRNEKRRFPVFVANRIQLIRDFSSTSQWKYVNTEENPADEASRGLSIEEFVKCHRWFNGPEFLSKPQNEWPEQPAAFIDHSNETNDLEVHAVEVDDSFTAVNQLLEHYSSWHKLKRAVAVYRRVFKYLQHRIQRRLQPTDDATRPNYTMNQQMSVHELSEAEYAIFRLVQQQSFEREIKTLSDEGHPGTSGRVPKDSHIYRLDPYLSDGLLRVGGRLGKSDLPEMTRNPILLHHKCHVTHLIIRWFHSKLGHAGRNHVLSTLRERFWVTHANSTVRHVISSCIPCRRDRASLTEQKMADLPIERMTPAPPFTHCGVDYFGPYIIKEGRKQMKRYGVLFTCLASRAVHLETANSLETQSFINALRRFIARRGAVQSMRSDNGTNFTGAERELFRALDREKIHKCMLSENIDWTFNPPAASHMGGIWERLIRCTRNILASLLLEFAQQLDDESLRTLLTEVEAIINSRPLTTVSSDVDDFEALTPNALLTLKTKMTTPPPGEFVREDLYSRRRWKRVQYLSNIFWTRWRKEYLLTLQERQKWNTFSRNMKVGDIVIVKDENVPRNNWQMGRITASEPDRQGIVRSVTLKTSTSELRRPVAKLVLLLAKEDQM